MAEVIKAEVTVSKEAYELGIALGKIAVEIKKALADGLDIKDAPAVLSVLMTPEVIAGFAGLENISTELKETKAAFVAAFVVAGVKVAEAL